MITLRKPAFLLVIALASLPIGCSSGGAGLRLNQHDATALEQLYESGGWSFSESRVGVRVVEGGTVEVEVEGLAASRGDGQNAAKPLWVPVVLLRELPPYYRAAEELAKSPVELHAYKAKGGLWCIVAELRMAQRAEGGAPPPSSAPPDAAREGGEPTPVRVRLTMVSPEFESKLPLLVPSGPVGGSTDASVTLPNNMRFSSLEFGGNEEIQARPSKLTVLPPQLSGGGNTAAAQLAAGDSAAWDFSRVSFTSQAARAPLGLKEISRMLSLLALGTGAYVTVAEWRRSRRRRKFAARLKTAKAEAAALRRKAEREFGRDSSLYAYAAGLEKAFAASPDYGEAWRLLLKVSESIEGVRRELDKARRRLGGGGRKEYELLDELEVRLERVEHAGLDESKGYAGDWDLRHEFRLLVIGLFVIGLLLFSQFAWGQNGVTRPAAPPPPGPRAAELREFGMATRPAKPDADDRDKVSVALDFYPVVNANVGEGESAEAKDNVEINTDDARAVIENFTHTDKVKLVSKARSQVVVEVPARRERDEQLPNTNSGSVESVALLKSFNPNKKDVMELKFDVRNAQSFDDRAWGWVHLFPWETIRVNLPLRLNRSAHVYNVEAQKPSTEYVGDVQVRDVIDPYDPKTGRPAFAEDYNRYRFYAGDGLSRKVIRPDTRVMLTAKFERTGFQRFVLTWFLPLAGLAAGVILGRAYRSAPTAFLPLSVEAAGLAGLYLGLWGLIFTKFTSIPTVFLGQGVTVSEIFFLAGCLLLLGASYVVRRL